MYNVYIKGNNYKESIMNEPITNGSLEDKHLHSINALESKKIIISENEAICNFTAQN